MINQFRILHPANVFFLIPFALIMCLGAFVHLPDNLRAAFFDSSIISLFDSSIERQISPVVNVLIAVTFTFMQALYLNKVVNKYNLLARSTFLPALLYVALASLFNSFLVLSPALLCNFLLIAIIDKLLSLYYNNKSKSLLFDLGILIAVGTLFYFPFIAFFPIIWISLVIFKPFNWREWLVSLIGFGTVFLNLFFIYFLLGRSAEFTNIWLPLRKKLITTLPQENYDYFALIIPVVILGLFIIKIRQNFYKSMVHTRKSFQVLAFIFLLGLTSFYLNFTFNESHFLLCVPPIAIYMAYYFNAGKKRWLYESLFALMVLSFIYFQWF